MNNLKDPRLNKKSPLYIPDYVKELGFTQEEADNLSEIDQPEIDRRTEIFRRAHIAKLELRKQELEARKLMELSTHWYCTLSKEEIKDLVTNSLYLVKPVLTEAIEKESIKGKAMYMFSLLKKIESGFSFNIRPAEKSKLKRFPKYDPGIKKIYGSKHTFIALWSHVYSDKKINSNVLISK